MYLCNTAGNVELSGVKIAPAIGVVSCGELIKHRMKSSWGLFEVANEELKSKTNMSVKRDIVICCYKTCKLYIIGPSIYRYKSDTQFYNYAILLQDTTNNEMKCHIA